ncbi:MAG: hypothetical protein EZS28_048810, partial [Streblomastix strix]
VHAQNQIGLQEDGHDTANYRMIDSQQDEEMANKENEGRDEWKYNSFNGRNDMLLL